MSKASESKTIWLAELYRFGYELKAIGETKNKAVGAVMKEYTKAFKDYNDGISPSKMRMPNTIASYYAIAKEDVSCTEFEFGKCYWL